jgi:RNA exonuclease 4
VEECRSRVLELLEGKILVGHALKNDLHALGITHPWYDTRDTAKYEPFMKIRFDDGILWPRKLKELAKDKLGRDVQKLGASHSAFEDAKTALDLYKLVRLKWEKAMEYKINKTREIERKMQHTICVVEAADVQQLAQ